MTIRELLKSPDHQARLTLSRDRWLCVDDEGGWIVYERKPYAKKTTVVIQTFLEELAVRNLIGEDTK